MMMPNQKGRYLIYLLFFVTFVPLRGENFRLSF
jgi:hypothetical protein